MLIYINDKPALIIPLSKNPFGFVRILDAETKTYISTLPAKFVARREGQITYNGTNYRWPLQKMSGAYINGVIHVAGPHTYAYYFSDKTDAWRESASITNEKLKELVKEQNIKNCKRL